MVLQSYLQFKVFKNPIFATDGQRESDALESNMQSAQVDYNAAVVCNKDVHFHMRLDTVTNYAMSELVWGAMCKIVDLPNIMLIGMDSKALWLLESKVEHHFCRKQ